MLVLLWIEITSQNLYLNLELFLDTTEDNPYCVIVSLVIWIFSFIYFVYFGFFIIFSSKEQIYLFTFIFITDDSCFAQVTLISLLLVSSWVTFNQHFCRWQRFSFYWFGKREFGKFTNGIPVIGGHARHTHTPPPNPFILLHVHGWCLFDETTVISCIFHHYHYFPLFG